MAADPHRRDGFTRTPERGGLGLRRSGGLFSNALQSQANCEVPESHDGHDARHRDNNAQEDRRLGLVRRGSGEQHGYDTANSDPAYGADGPAVSERERPRTR